MIAVPDWLVAIMPVVSAPARAATPDPAATRGA
jgi:hypothetical protein